MAEATDPSLLQTIGGTPMVTLRHVVPSGSARVLVKLESHNPTGSMKDRMALSVVQGALAAGRLAPGGRVVEYTGGSTGTSLAFVWRSFTPGRSCMGPPRLKVAKRSMASMRSRRLRGGGKYSSSSGSGMSSRGRHTCAPRNSSAAGRSSTPSMATIGELW